MTIPYINQVNTTRFGSKQNRALFDQLASADFTKRLEHYSRKSAEMRRAEADPTMKARIFGMLITETARLQAILLVGSPDPEDIRYYLRVNDRDGVEHSATINAPYDTHDLERVCTAYHAAFGRDLLKEPVKPEILEHYGRMIENYPPSNRWK
jgi:hypothetical protein